LTLSRLVRFKGLIPQGHFRGAAGMDESYSSFSSGCFPPLMQTLTLEPSHSPPKYKSDPLFGIVLESPPLIVIPVFLARTYVYRSLKLGPTNLPERFLPSHYLQVSLTLLFWNTTLFRIGRRKQVSCVHLVTKPRTPSPCPPMYFFGSFLFRRPIYVLSTNLHMFELPCG